MITAISYKATIDTPKCFKKSRTVGAHFGMTPKQYSSGEMKKQTGVSKFGNREMRMLLTEAEVVLMTRSKKWSKLKTWGLKIKQHKR